MATSPLNVADGHQSPAATQDVPVLNMEVDAPPLLGLSSLPNDPMAGLAHTNSVFPDGISAGASPELGLSHLPEGPLAGQATPLARPLFDPKGEEAATKRHLYKASPKVQSYVEQYFRTIQSDAVVKEMTSKDPRPDTAACVVPTVDDAVASWLGEELPKTMDSGLHKLQQNFLSACGPLTQLWEDIISNGDSMDVPTDVVLDAVQRSLVLLGHANARMTAHRRAAILEGAGHKALAKDAKELPLPKEGTSLFGDTFYKELEQKGEVRKTLAKSTSAWTNTRCDRLPTHHRSSSEGFSSRPWQSRPGAYSRASRPAPYRPQRPEWSRPPQHPTGGASRGRSDWDYVE